ASAREQTCDQSGSRRPLSHGYTPSLVSPIRSPSSRCVSPRSLRSSCNLSPNSRSRLDRRKKLRRRLSPVNHIRICSPEVDSLWKGYLVLSVIAYGMDAPRSLLLLVKPRQLPQQRKEHDRNEDSCSKIGLPGREKQVHNEKGSDRVREEERDEESP